MATTEESGDSKAASATYEAGCHCGYIRFAVTLSPPLPEHRVMSCNCSICRRAGYLLVYPDRGAVAWEGDSRARCAVYQFNTKRKDHLFCPRCGASIGIDFRDSLKPKLDGYGISVRTFNGIDLDTLNLKLGNGLENVKPAGDLSGTEWKAEAA